MIAQNDEKTHTIIFVQRKKLTMEQISVNKHGGAFRVCKHYSFEKKVLVMETFHELQRVDPMVKPTISSVAKESKVLWDYAKKVMLEIHQYGTIIPQ